MDSNNDYLRLHLASFRKIDDEHERFVAFLASDTSSKLLAVLIDKHTMAAFALKASSKKCPHGHEIRVWTDFMSEAMKNGGVTVLDTTIYEAAAGELATVTRFLEKEHVFAARASLADGVLFATVAKVPLLIERRLLERAGSVVVKMPSEDDLPVSERSLDMLEKNLEEAIEKEKYELAAMLRDEIRRRKGRDAANENNP